MSISRSNYFFSTIIYLEITLLSSDFYSSGATVKFRFPPGDQPAEKCIDSFSFNYVKVF